MRKKMEINSIMLVATPWLHRSLIVVVVLAMLAGFQGCSSAPVTQAATAVPATEKAATPPPTKQDDSYVASGPIIVENQVDVLALRGGVISQISADVGSSVHKDEVLAVIDDREVLAQRDAAEAKLKSTEADLKDWEAETKLAESDYKRAQSMREAGINTQEALEHAKYKLEGSKFEIEKAERELDNARDNLRYYELELQKAHIRAPFDGVVARRYVRVGQTAAPGDRMFWVSAVAPLLVRFTLPERFLNQIKTGGQIYVSALSSPDKNYPAKIVQVSPLVDPASDSIDVLAKLSGKPDGLRPGMTANIHLTPPVEPSR
jgi:RND family efflux transporter MFP subunit